MKLNFKENKKHRLAAITTLGSLLGIAVLVIAGVSYAYAYNDRFFPGSTVAGIQLGGMSYDEGLALVNSRADMLIEEGAEITINGSTRTIPLHIVSPDDPDLSQDLVVIDAQPTVQYVFDRGREGNLVVRTWDMLYLGVARPNQLVDVETNVEAIETNLLETFSEYYDPAEEPSFEIVEEEGEWTVSLKEGRAGRAFDLDYAVHAFTSMMANLNNEEVHIAVIDQEPSVNEDEAEELIPHVQDLLAEAPFTLDYEVNRFEDYSYSLDDDLLAAALVLVNTKEDGVQLSVSEDMELFTDMVEDINIESEDARFAMSNNRVQEFSPSVDGREVNIEGTRSAIMARLNNTQDLVCDCLPDEPCPCDEEDEGSVSIAIMVDNTEPDITTAEVNDLGIVEVIGVGYSDFSGSPSNRIKNIRHGINKLDGLLIAPGEEMSLIDELKPFTLSDGYLPELVIKGDEIKPEIGGGLCQIGSTTFRAVMNSGLGITQRRNHSLVVNYYNDPSNGNPGTDATLYDPNPDFRFVNDTEHHILLDTSMNVSSGLLTFTFWGTSDGRNGYYTPPVVHNWTSPGPTRTTYTTELAPGVRRCQGAHPGANTSFSYFIERPDGEVEEIVYESHYRSLPTICLEGVAPEQLDEEGNLIEVEEEAEEEVEIEELDDEEVLETVE